MFSGLSRLLFGDSEKTNPATSPLFWPPGSTSSRSKCIKITTDLDVDPGNAVFITGTKIDDWKQAPQMKYNTVSKLWEIYLFAQQCATQKDEINEIKFLVGPWSADPVVSVDKLCFQSGDNLKLAAGNFSLTKRDFPEFFVGYQPR